MMLEAVMDHRRAARSAWAMEVELGDNLICLRLQYCQVGLARYQIEKCDPMAELEAAWARQRAAANELKRLAALANPDAARRRMRGKQSSKRKPVQSAGSKEAFKEEAFEEEAKAATTTDDDDELELMLDSEDGSDYDAAVAAAHGSTPRRRDRGRQNRPVDGGLCSVH